MLFLYLDPLGTGRIRTISKLQNDFNTLVFRPMFTETNLIIKQTHSLLWYLVKNINDIKYKILQQLSRARISKYFSSTFISGWHWRWLLCPEWRCINNTLETWCQHLWTIEPHLLTFPDSRQRPTVGTQLSLLWPSISMFHFASF